jgi:FkbM family methyltransferase
MGSLGEEGFHSNPRNNSLDRIYKMYPMKKILYISPHLSTGGLPQFLLKKIEILDGLSEIYLIEYSNITGGKFVVQRNRIRENLGENFFSLSEDKNEILDIIQRINPDVIHLEEMPEFFMDDNIADIIYSTDRNYKVFETSHDSSFDPLLKRYLPDKFLFVSSFQKERFSSLGIPSEVIEYPIEYMEMKSDRRKICNLLGVDPLKKHILHVGLFTPRKNQKEFFDFARSLPEYDFHCVGNQADNFQTYWEPLMQNKPDNLTVWGERSDVDLFYQFCDLFLFTSKGDSHDKETMPLVIRESISWDIPTFIYDLPVYKSYFDSYPTIKYLSENFQTNVQKIQDLLSPQKKNKPTLKKCIIVDTFVSSPDKEDLLIENLRTFRLFGHDIFLVSHSKLSQKVLDEVDYFLFDRDNSFNENHVYSWRKDEGREIRINIRKSHEWPIIRSMRLAFNTAKSLGYEYFIFTEFDHKYSQSDVDRVQDLIEKSIEREKEMIFWAPQERVDYGGYGNETGIFYETCFFSGYLDEFLKIFESSFPKTLEEYNQNFASQFPNSLEFWFWKHFSPSSEKYTIVPNYVKLDLKDSDINVSSYQNFKCLILPSSKHHYLYITNDNFIDYDFKVYFNNQKSDEFKLNRYYKLIRLEENCQIRIDAFSEGNLVSSDVMEYDSDSSDEYEKNGIIIFNNNEESDLFEISFDTADNKIFIDYLSDERREVQISIKDIDSKSTIWSFKNVAENKSKWWCVPTPKHVLDYENQVNFGGVLVEVYENNKMIYDGEIRIKKPLVYKPEMPITITEPIFSNYNEFFVDKIYSHLDIHSLDTVFDIGANVGLWTEWVLRQNTSRVFCFEPNRVALGVLKKLHGSKRNVTIIDKAVDSEIKTIEFFYSDSNSLISATEKHGELDRSYKVQTTTIDEVIDSHSITHIDLIKMDIEGAEFRIFESLNERIYDITDSFLIEFHAFYYSDGKEREERIIKKLKDRGFFIENHPGGIYATKHKKCFYVNNSVYALDVPGLGALEKINLWNDARNFSWDLLSKKRLLGYHHAYNEIFNHPETGCIYEFDCCRIESGDVVVDIGANIGIFTHLAYRRGASKIFSFEPSTEAYQALTLNTHGISETFKMGISDRSVFKKLYYSQGDTMSSTLHSESDVYEMCSLETLDLLCEKGLFTSIDFLKIDAEGSELPILRGAREMLTNGLISKISMEYHSAHDPLSEIEKVCEEMENFGFDYSMNPVDENISFYYFWKS